MSRATSSPATSLAWKRVQGVCPRTVPSLVYRSASSVRLTAAIYAARAGMAPMVAVDHPQRAIVAPGDDQRRDRPRVPVAAQLLQAVWRQWPRVAVTVGRGVVDLQVRDAHPLQAVRGEQERPAVQGRLGLAGVAFRRQLVYAGH